ncbi:MAG: sigma-70 family RNA polymerase sigma factor [Archangium sp.]|nr:sigma-70 family RNA polymerase sigma factor [Archangium sp.]MDP3573666.1 sigma-70 family RNA polymerase sigma factor [Archangium sp.]
MALDIGELFERYHGVVFRRCQNLLRDPHDAEEAVQEVFVAAISGFGRFRLRSAPLTWLYSVATRHCLQRLRNQNTQALKRSLFHEEEAVEVDLAARADLEKVLSKLSLADLELITLAYRDGLTHEEIAQVTRQSRKTVGKKLASLLIPLFPRERVGVRAKTAVNAA